MKKPVHLKQSKDYTIQYEDASGKQSSFHCSKAMLEEHKQKLSNNYFIKSFSISAYKEKK